MIAWPSRALVGLVVAMLVPGVASVAQAQREPIRIGLLNAMEIFLDRARRMHPDVCRFVSEIVCDNRLVGLPSLAAQKTAFGTGLRFLPVEHVGNVGAAPEEAERVAQEILRRLGVSWTK